jgi:diacylglycerol kinase (ATP)
MPHNKPKYTLFKNASYALSGLIEVIKNETSFQIELFFMLLMGVVAIFLPISFGYKAILLISLLVPLMAELANSAIERVVDLVTKEYHILAKHAKDAGSALVLVSIITTTLVWITVLLLAFNIV